VLVVSTVATDLAVELWREYERIFQKLDVQRIKHLDIRDRADADADPALDVLKDATVVFFTGGDQLQITSKLGGTKTADRIMEIYAAGGVIAGTSAGASVMSETMLVSGEGRESHRIGNALQLAPGLGLVQGLIIDQHFAQRGRIGRLLGAVAQNPRILGIGIDEDTAIVVDGANNFEVIGSGAVYVVDGHDMTFSNIFERDIERTMSAFDMRLHILSHSTSFDYKSRRPKRHREKNRESRQSK
jgi:cyanophycinase